MDILALFSLPNKVLNRTRALTPLALCHAPHFPPESRGARLTNQKQILNCVVLPKHTHRVRGNCKVLKIINYFCYSKWY